jgi:hypothetical protein
MSLMSITHTMFRISSATPASPIAVFRCNENKEGGEVNAVFAATVKTHQMIAAGDPDLIGVYDGSMDLVEVERVLRNVKQKEVIKTHCAEVICRARP